MSNKKKAEKEIVNKNRVAHLSKYFYSMSKLSWHDHKCGKGRMHLVKTRSNLVMWTNCNWCASKSKFMWKGVATWVRIINAVTFARV